MKIAFSFEKDQKVDLTVEQGGSQASDRVDLWGKAHRAFEGLAGRINVYEEEITQASTGQLRRRRDGKVTLDLLNEEDPGEISLSLSRGRKGLVRTIPKEQKRGWGAGEFYMLPVDANDRVIYEPGERHRKVYISASPQAMDKAAIAAHAGVSTSAVTASWLDANRQYGGSRVHAGYRGHRKDHLRPPYRIRQTLQV